MGKNGEEAILIRELVSIMAAILWDHEKQIIVRNSSCKT